MQVARVPELISIPLEKLMVHRLMKTGTFNKLTSKFEALGFCTFDLICY